MGTVRRRCWYQIAMLSVEVKRILKEHSECLAKSNYKDLTGFGFCVGVCMCVRDMKF